MIIRGTKNIWYRLGIACTKFKIFFSCDGAYIQPICRTLQQYNEEISRNGSAIKSRKTRIGRDNIASVQPACRLVNKCPCSSTSYPSCHLQTLKRFIISGSVCAYDRNVR